MWFSSKKISKRYFIAIGDKTETTRLIGPFGRLVDLEKYVKKNQEHAFFNPFKEKVNVMVSQEPKDFIKNAMDIFNNILCNKNIIDFSKYRKKKR